MDDSDAPQIPRHAIRQKCTDLVRGLDAVHPVQVKVRLYHPVAATQSPEQLSRQPRPQVDQFLPGIQCVVK